MRLEAEHRLEIAFAWDGSLLPRPARAYLLFRLAPHHLTLALDAPFHEDPPPPGPPGPTAKLWEHEVVEAFLAGPGAPDHVPYTEIELSPHGHHLVLRLAGVRRTVEERLPLRFRARIHDRRWRGVAQLRRTLLPPPPWRINAFAMHGQGPHRVHHVATALPGSRPDFHQPQHFPPLPLSFLDPPATATTASGASG
jgi:hypothetical protein